MPRVQPTDDSRPKKFASADRRTASRARQEVWQIEREPRRRQRDSDSAVSLLLPPPRAAVHGHPEQEGKDGAGSTPSSLRAATRSSATKRGPRRLGTPGSQGGVFVGRSDADPKEVAVKVFYTTEQSSAPKEAVLLPLERPLRMRRMPRPKLTTLHARAWQAMLVAANAGGGHRNILGLVEANPLIEIDEKLGKVIVDGKEKRYSQDAIVMPIAPGGDFLEYAESDSFEQMTTRDQRTATATLLRADGRRRPAPAQLVDRAPRPEAREHAPRQKRARARLMIMDFGMADVGAGHGRQRRPARPPVHGRGPALRAAGDAFCGEAAASLRRRQHRRVRGGRVVSRCVPVEPVARVWDLQRGRHAKKDALHRDAGRAGKGRVRAAVRVLRVENG